MIRHPIQSIVTISTFIALIATPLSAEPGNDEAARRIADAMLKAQLDMNGVPGMSAAVARDGKIIWKGAVGLRDIERDLPVTPETSFRFASVSKLLTATAAISLKEQGRLDLNAPVQSMISGLNADWPSITATQLAAHISGIAHYQDGDEKRGDEHFTSISDAVNIFAARPLLSAPGTRYEYSSWGYTLLSAVVEAAAGKKFLDHVADDVTKGLAIRPDLGPLTKRDSEAYEFENGSIRKAPAHDYSYSWGGAGFRGTAPALALFGARVMNDSFLSSKARQQMWTPARLANGEPVKERNFEVGFGWRIGQDGAGDRIVHQSGLALGARSSLVVYPDDRYSVSVLSNSEWVSSIEQTATMLAAPFRVSDKEAAVPCPLASKSYEGTFGNETVTGTVRFALVDGHCEGYIGVENAAGAWLNSFFQKDAAELRIFAVKADGQLGRAALVTPSGIYDFREQPDGAYSARLGTNRQFTIRFGTGH